ncbi:hypothetical protein AWB69_08220 [Caballeronia udeis]|uniref:Uncharacterized protein n=1 Tax=Caballeronia udeis TaxID=1232866 RepID=A0A158JKY1_9BURK|nr:hypothetical protein AWB69_08220 [Caballeronia udeis]
MTVSRAGVQERSATCGLPAPFRNGCEALCGCLSWTDTPKINRTPPLPCKTRVFSRGGPFRLHGKRRAHERVEPGSDLSGAGDYRALRGAGCRRRAAALSACRSMSLVMRGCSSRPAPLGPRFAFGGCGRGGGDGFSRRTRPGGACTPLTEGGALFKSQLKTVKKEEVNRARVYGPRDARGTWVCGAFGGSIDASAVVG